MRLVVSILLFGVLGTSALAQRTKTDLLNAATNPADDAKGLSESVPDVYSVSSQFQRVITLRFKNQTDLLAGLEKVVKQEKIQNAVILGGFGSVINYHVHVVSNRTFPSKNMFIKDPTTPADIANMSGYVLNGRLHPHITLADSDKAFGGHIEPGTQVFTFAVVTLGVFPDNLDLKRMDDKSFR